MPIDEAREQGKAKIEETVKRIDKYLEGVSKTRVITPQQFAIIKEEWERIKMRLKDIMKLTEAID